MKNLFWRWVNHGDSCDFASKIGLNFVSKSHWHFDPSSMQKYTAESNLDETNTVLEYVSSLLFLQYLSIMLVHLGIISRNGGWSPSKTFLCFKNLSNPGKWRWVTDTLHRCGRLGALMTLAENCGWLHRCFYESWFHADGSCLSQELATAKWFGSSLDEEFWDLRTSWIVD